MLSSTTKLLAAANNYAYLLGLFTKSKGSKVWWALASSDVNDDSTE